VQAELLAVRIELQSSRIGRLENEHTAAMKIRERLAVRERSTYEEVAVVAFRNIDYWARTKFIVPSIAEAKGTGRNADAPSLTCLRCVLPENCGKLEFLHNLSAGRWIFCEPEKALRIRWRSAV
jgi:hypothetical protein